MSLRSQDVVLADAVVMPGSPLEGLSVRRMRLHQNYGINLLALFRQREPVQSRLRAIEFEVGDLLLLQGERHTLDHAVDHLGCLMLSQRSPIGARRRSRIWLLPLIIGVALLAADTFTV